MPRQQLYSVDQVAELLGLHVKTVRGYVRDGRLPATRIGKQYRIARDDLEAFTGQPVAPPAATTRWVEVSAIVHVDAVSVTDMHRLTTLLTASVAGHRAAERPVRVESMYDEQRAELKIIVVASPDDCAEILRLVSMFTEEPT